MITSIRFRVAIAISIVALVGTSFSLTRAASVFDITFPIPELGNCADRAACKAYCNDVANQSACQSFAEAHGLTVRAQSNPDTGSQGDTGTNDKLLAIQKDGGPGNCAVGASNPEKTCRAYCNATAHIQECVSYGKSHGFLRGDQLAQAEKVAAALKSGVPLPQGCTDQQSCEETCQNPTSLDQAKSCFAFAKAAGLLPPGFDESKAEKVFSAIHDGSAPFSSMKDFQQCEHASDPSVIKKCTDFAVKSGMMTQEQADVVQQTGGKGPGGCQGKDECEQYCADHQDECFQFSQEHNLIRPEQRQHMQAAANQIKQALDHAPAGAKDCITAAVGQDVLDGLLAGTKPGTPQIGSMMRQCFDQAQQSGEQGDGEQQFGPPQGDQNGQGDMGHFNDESGNSGEGTRVRVMTPPGNPSGRSMKPPPGNDQGTPMDQVDQLQNMPQWQGEGGDRMMPNSAQRTIDGQMDESGQGAPGQRFFSPSNMRGGDMQNGGNPGTEPSNQWNNGARPMQPGSRQNGGNGGNWMPPPLQSGAQQMRPSGNQVPPYMPGNYNGPRPGGMMPGPGGPGPQNMGPDNGSMPGNFQNGMQGQYPNDMQGGQPGDGQQFGPPAEGTGGMIAPPPGSSDSPISPPPPTAPESFIGTIRQLAGVTFSFFSSH